MMYGFAACSNAVFAQAKINTQKTKSAEKKEHCEDYDVFHMCNILG